jgi:NADPH:quinone reductase-like Zn-dependent oxidoreductase
MAVADLIGWSTKMPHNRIQVREKCWCASMRPVWFVVEPNREQLIQIGALIDAGRIRPIIDTVLPLSQARQAYEQGARGHTRGKIVLRVVD